MADRNEPHTSSEVMAPGEIAELCHDTLSLLLAGDYPSIPDTALGDTMVAIERLRAVVEAGGACVAGRFAASGVWRADGSPSAGSWVAARTPARRSQVNRAVRAGRRTQHLASAWVAAARGEIGLDHLVLLGACCRPATHAAASAAEELLVGQAKLLDPDRFGVFIRAWIDRANPNDDGTTRPQDQQRSWAHLSQHYEGWWELSGRFAPEVGREIHDLVQAKLDSLVRQGRDHHDPTLDANDIAGRRADAIAELILASATHGPGERRVPDRYRVNLVVALDDPADMSRYGIALCDSWMAWTVTAKNGEVLAVGRSQRTWPDAIRRAVTARDRHCVFPGCDRGPQWCDVHHCVAWDQGGTTDLDNGALLCWHHHRWLHRNPRWHLRIPRPGAPPEVVKPDGTIHTTPARHTPPPRDGRPPGHQPGEPPVAA